MPTVYAMNQLEKDKNVSDQLEGIKKDAVIDIAFGPLGDKVATTSHDGTWKLWNIASKYHLFFFFPFFILLCAHDQPETKQSVLILVRSQSVSQVSGSMVFPSLTRSTFLVKAPRSSLPLDRESPLSSFLPFITFSPKREKKKKKIAVRV